MGGHLKLWKDVGIWGFSSRIWFSAAEIALTSSYNAAFYSAVLPIYLFLGHSFNLYISDSERFPLFICPLKFAFAFYFIFHVFLSVCVRLLCSHLQNSRAVGSSLPFPLPPSIHPSISHMATALPLGHISLQLPSLPFNLPPRLLFIGICWWCKLR